MTKRDDLLKRQAQLSSTKRSLLDRLKGGAATSAQAIPRRAEAGPAPLSFSQQGLWILDQVMPGMVAYNMPVAARLTGPLAVGLLHDSLNAVAQRQAALRTTFTTVDEQPMQVIAPAAEFSLPLPLVDLSEHPEQMREQESWRLVEQEILRPFDLEHGPLVRGMLLRLSPQQHVLVLTIHHIISDTWSREVLIRELMTFYTAFATDTAVPLPELSIQYADYAAWQRRQAGELLDQQLSYWKQQLAGAPPVLQLPVARPRPAVQTFGGARHPLSFPTELVQSLAALSQREEVTLFMTMVAAFQVLLQRYSGSDDIVIGTDIANRTRPETEALIGFFVNMLVLRTDLAGDPSFHDVLGRVRTMMLQAFANQDLPFERLVEAVQPERNLSHLPLFQIMFSFQAAHELDAAPGERSGLTTTIEGLGLSLEPLSSDGGTAKFDLELVLLESPGRLNGYFEYNTDLFTAPTIARLADHFQVLLAAIAADPHRPISALPLLTQAERRQLQIWSGTLRDKPEQHCFHRLFEAQVARTPDATAVIFSAADSGAADDEYLTYDQLNRRANALARLLLARGVGPELLVTLLAERSPRFLIAMLAIFKAGAAYLPLDPYHPPQRLRQVIEDSKTPLVLATATFGPVVRQALELIAPDARPALLDLEDLLQQPEDESNLPSAATPDNLAYVIYTSGSTGVPKGAMVEQRGMLNHLYGKIDDLGMTAQDTVIQNASQCFDISVWQFLAALLLGGRVHIVADEIAHHSARLLDLVDMRQVSILEVVPSLLQSMLEEIARRGAARPALAALRWLVPTGEALPPDLARHWLGCYPAIPLLNAYGPTECSDDVTHHPILEPPALDVVRMPIGRPIRNMLLHVLDQRLAPVPLGVIGELYVGGVGVGRGYLDRPDLTAEIFMPDPFTPRPGARLYRTGDLARLLEDGAIEFLGRTDHQVKLRGYRIELGEIAAALREHPAVREVAVLARPDATGEQRLVAYVVEEPRTKNQEPGDGGEGTREQPNKGTTEQPNEWADRSESEETAIDAVGSQFLVLGSSGGSQFLVLGSAPLRAWLKDKLPDYMIPTAFVPLPALPLTPNGKIDRRALPEPEPDVAVYDEATAAPRTPVEQVIANIWGHVLGLARVGRQDNFFDLGGHSLRAIQTIARLQDVFPVPLSLRMLFESPTVAGLAYAIEQASPAAQVDVERVAQLFLSLSQISDDEVERMLSEIE